MAYNFVAHGLRQRNSVADFLLEKCNFSRKTAFCVFEPTFGGLEAMYVVHHRLIRKRVVDFLLVFTQLFYRAA